MSNLQKWTIVNNAGSTLRPEGIVNPNLPPRPVRAPHPRHRLLAVRQNTYVRPLNSVIEPTVDVTADIGAINRGEALRHGDIYAVNGRTYRLEPAGRLYPIAGPGIHPLNRDAFKALGVYNRFGLTSRAEDILDQMGKSPADRAAARVVWHAGHDE
jgi:hypothetical protein